MFGVFDRSMRRLRSAIVRAAKEATAGRVLTLEGPVTVHRVTIVEDDGHAFVLLEDAENTCIADTWHESVEAAMAAVVGDYEIGPWEPAPSSLPARSTCVDPNQKNSGK
jgi:hypothetical protein